MKKLINPFIYFSGGTTLCTGLVVMAAMVVIAGLTGQTFRGVISYGIGDYPFWRLALHLAGSWVIFSLLLYGAARAFSPSKVRLIDVAGNQALAKLPGMLILIYGAFSLDEVMNEANLLMQKDMAALQNYSPSANILLLSFVAIIATIWFFAWSWNGFSIAANMRGRRAIGIYIVCYLLAEVLSGFVCQI